MVKNDLAGIPFAYGHQLFIAVGQVHCIIAAGFLPVFQFIGPARIINNLIFGSGFISSMIFGIFYHMIQYAAVAAFVNFPLPAKFKIGV